MDVVKNGKASKKRKTKSQKKNGQSTAAAESGAGNHAATIRKTRGNIYDNKPSGRCLPSSSVASIPSASNKKLQSLVAPHIESFNYMLDHGLRDAVRDIPPVDIKLEQGPALRIWLDEPLVQKPCKNEDTRDTNLWPAECRERGMMYSGALLCTVCVQVEGQQPQRIQKRFGNLPVMVGSNRCHLSGKTPEELVQHHEEGNELGGYFICNGIERVIRLLQIPRRNHIMAVDRSSFAKRGPGYTNKAVSIKCVRHDQSSQTVTLHYLSDGNAILRFSLLKQEFFVPVVLVMKALIDISDREIFLKVLRRGTHPASDKNKNSTDSTLVTRLENLLQRAKDCMVYTKDQCSAYLGSRFRSILSLPDSMTDVEAGQELLHRFVLVHLSDHSSSIGGGGIGEDKKSTVDASGLSENAANEAKVEVLLLMLRKLYKFVDNEICEDNPDALANHELLLSGHLYQQVLKEKLYEAMIGVRAAMLKDGRDAAAGRRDHPVLSDLTYIKKHLDRAGDVGKKLAHLLSTGNLVSQSGLDLMQVSGFTIVADKLNFLRFLSHFRSVHRGQFFTTMKTTAVRKLLPESWGFMCPVHTPDGSPCGLLNHLAAECVLITHPTHVDRGSSSSSSSSSSSGSGGTATTSAGLIRGIMSALGSLGMHEKSSMFGSQGDVHNRTPTHMQVDLQNKLLAEKEAKPSGGGRGVSLIPVMLDGRLIGGVEVDAAREMVSQLRVLKRRGEKGIPKSLECCCVPPVVGGTSPGVFLFTEPGRMIRPVQTLVKPEEGADVGDKNSKNSWGKGELEHIGPMEQMYMNIAVLKEDVLPHSKVRVRVSKGKGKDGEEGKFKTVVIKDGTTHVEISPMNILSVASSLTPFSDQNQSPRNMYQCQMAKQTMGTPLHAHKHRVDNKVYRIQTPQAPLVQNVRQSDYQIDEYPLGTNAVVAVISYTGFDMEDAMILNKSAYERGFAHASIYKNMQVKVRGDNSMRGGDKEEEYFSNVMPKGAPGRGRAFEEAKERGGGPPLYTDKLDPDGLPYAGQLLKTGDPICCIVNSTTGQARYEKHKEGEPAFVDQVTVVGDEGAAGAASAGKKGGKVRGPARINIKLRFNRNPIVGDKFSSRHGQKGVMSVLWPQVDMPFTESGMSPDVLINPHAFPSRMTIGMLVESMAGKAGALHGVFQDGTPFRFHEKQRAVDYFGEQLKTSGYSYVGSEPLYSGLYGTKMHADIYIGLVYYQRLRHMVSDKSQVRATGPINPITRQPIKGRKKHGGIRLGEMERDALLAHGTSFLLHDRLMNCSDRHEAHICCRCNSLLAPHARRHDALSMGEDEQTISMQARTNIFCPVCENDKARADAGEDYKIATVPLPYVFRYLVNELAGMNIKIDLKCEAA